MQSNDAQRWDSRYQEGSRDSFEQPRKLLIDYSSLLPKQGLALDIAMGLGGNAFFLLKQGMKVIGVDISFTALRKVKAKQPDLMTVVGDLNSFYIPQSTFEVIIDFLYLQRDLWVHLVHGLKPGGLLFVECLTMDMLTIRPEIDRSYLLRKGELQRTFQRKFSNSMVIVHYFEGWQPTPTSRPKAVASLIARRIP